MVFLKLFTYILQFRSMLTFQGEKLSFREGGGIDEKSLLLIRHGLGIGFSVHYTPYAPMKRSVRQRYWRVPA